MGDAPIPGDHAAGLLPGAPAGLEGEVCIREWTRAPDYMPLPLAGQGSSIERDMYKRREWDDLRVSTAFLERALSRDAG